MTYNVEIIKWSQNYETKNNDEIKSQSYDLESHNYKSKLWQNDDFKGQNWF